MKTVLTLLVVAVLATGVSAQMVDRASLASISSSRPLGVKPASSPWSLLDFSKMRFTHSYSFGYFSGSGHSGSTGLLRSSMLYEFSPKLSMALSLGVLHDPAALVKNGNSNSSLLPGFSLDYHPSSSFRVILDIQSYGGHYSSSWFGNSYPITGVSSAEKK